MPAFGPVGTLCKVFNVNREAAFDSTVFNLVFASSTHGTCSGLLCQNHAMMMFRHDCVTCVLCRDLMLPQIGH